MSYLLLIIFFYSFVIIKAEVWLWGYLLVSGITTQLNII